VAWSTPLHECSLLPLVLFVRNPWADPCSFMILFLPMAGGNGYINDFPTGRFLRDAKLYEIGAGTSEIRRMLIGREFNKEFGVSRR